MKSASKSPVHAKLWWYSAVGKYRQILVQLIPSVDQMSGWHAKNLWFLLARATLEMIIWSTWRINRFHRAFHFYSQKKSMTSKGEKADVIREWWIGLRSQHRVHFSCRSVWSVSSQLHHLPAAEPVGCLDVWFMISDVVAGLFWSFRCRFGQMSRWPGKDQLWGLMTWYY